MVPVDTRQGFGVGEYIYLHERNRPVQTVAIRQAVVVPLGSMVGLMLVCLTVPGYSSISQHMSELGLLGGYPAILLRALAITAGASIIVFSLALFWHPGERFSFTSATSMLFGINMLSNGVFTMGSPLHGLYGVGLFVVLTPALFAAEMNPAWRDRKIFVVSKWVAILTQCYFWLSIMGLDPDGFHGLTQRLFSILIFGWYSYVSYTLITEPAA